MSDYRPREIHIEIQNPAYYLGILKFSMLGNLSNGSDDFQGMNALAQKHEALRQKNAVKVGILIEYLTTKLEDIGEGNFWIGGQFPEEKMWEDLAKFSDNEISKIKGLADGYYAIIVAKLN